ncbi:hypothetical protein JXI42_01795 [bacterium]|nr:hypothetical protein [bacterium]
MFNGKSFYILIIIFIACGAIQVFADCESDWEDRPYPLDYAWAFSNWATVTPLSMDELSDVYVDINEDSPFGSAMYSLYTSLVTGMANCSGMSLLSVIIRKEKGHMGYCSPVGFYDGNRSNPTFYIDNSPEDTLLNKTIKKMQVKLLTYEFLNFLAELILDLQEHEDPEYAYDQAEYYLSEGDYPLLIMVNETFEAHTIVPYCCKMMSAGHYRMYVYDPNRPYIENRYYYTSGADTSIYYEGCRSFYDNDSNYVTIDNSYGTYKWNFDFGSSIWPGTSWWSVLCPLITVPYSLWKTAYNSPFMFGAEVASGFSSVIPGLSPFIDQFNALVMAGALPSQITDDEGHRFFKSEKNVQYYSDLEQDSDMKIPNMFFVPLPFKAGSEEQPRMFVIKDAGKNLNVDVYSKTGKYDFQVAGPMASLKLEGSGSPGSKGKIEINAISTTQQSYKIQPQAGQQSYNVKMDIFERQEKRVKTFEVSNLKISPGSPVEMAVTRAAVNEPYGLMVKSEKQQLSYDLKITQAEEGKKTSIEEKNIKVEPGVWQKQQPSEWKNLNKSKIETIEVKKTVPKKTLDNRQNVR